MGIFAQQRKKFWAMLPLLGLMLFASAAWAGDNPDPKPPKHPAVPAVPQTPGAQDFQKAPSATLISGGTEGPDGAVDPVGIRRAVSAVRRPGDAPFPSASVIPGVPKASEAPWMPRYFDS